MKRALTTAVLAMLLTACSGSGQTASSDPPPAKDASVPTPAPTPAPTQPAGCELFDYRGTATITAVTPITTVCGEGAEVTFDFTPDDPTAPSRYKFPFVEDTSVKWDQTRRSRACLSKLGIEVGSKVGATRMEATGGCDPWGFRLDVPDTSCPDACGK